MLVRGLWNVMCEATAIGVLALGAVACGRDTPPVDIIERAGGAQRLREAVLAVRSYAPHGEGEVPIPKGAWPEAIRRLEPEVVTADAAGVYITLKVDTLYASGIYAVFELSSKPKSIGSDLSFNEVVPGIFWYRMLMGG